MKIKFEGICPHCQKPIELIRGLSPELVEAICKTPQQVLHPDTTQDSIIDLVWLKEALETLQWATCVGWLNDHFKTNGRKVSEIVKELTPDQAEEFVAEVQSRLEMA